MHGWLYIEWKPTITNGFGFDSKLNDWLWTSSEIIPLQPNIISFPINGEGYIWHSPGSRDPRWFFDYDANAWFTDELRFSVNVELDNPTYGKVLEVDEGKWLLAKTECPPGIRIFLQTVGREESPPWKNAIELALSRSVTLLARFSKKFHLYPLKLSIRDKESGMLKEWTPTTTEVRFC